LNIALKGILVGKAGHVEQEIICGLDALKALTVMTLGADASSPSMYR
jgi:hypothetical protein